MDTLWRGPTGQLYYRPAEDAVYIPIHGREFFSDGKFLRGRWAWATKDTSGVVTDDAGLVPASMPRGKFLHGSQNYITLVPGTNGELPIRDWTVARRDWTRRRGRNARTRRQNAQLR